MWIELRADRAAQGLDLFDHRLATKNGVSDQVRMTTDIFGQRIERDIGAVLDRPLEDRSEQGVVADNDRHMALSCTNHVGHASDHRDIDQTVGRIGRRLDQDDGDAALGHRLFRRLLHRSFADAVGKSNGGDAEVQKGLGQQCFGSPVERLRMQDRIPRPDEGEQSRGYRRHAG